MKATIERLTRMEAVRCIFDNGLDKIGWTNPWSQGIAASTMIWCCKVDGQIACIWGLQPKSLASDVCYVWVYAMEDLREPKFRFMRLHFLMRSYKLLREMQERYPIITGHVVCGNENSVRWLRALGAELGEPVQGNGAMFMPLTIRK